MIRLLTLKPYVPSAALQAFPKVSVVFAAYNEAEIIEDKIRSIYATNYPTDQLEVWIGSDLSDDGTDQKIIALGNEFPNLFLHVNEHRSGKSATINRLVENCSGEIIVGTDANILFQPSTLTELVRPILNDGAVAVAGSLEYTVAHQENTTSKSEGSYLSLENKIRLSESQKFGFCLGMEGGLYAMLKSNWIPIPPATFMEDFFQTMQIIGQGGKVLFNPNAIGIEDVSTSMKEEFKRKIRISIGNFQNLRRFWRQLFSYPAGWAFLAHKVLRWLTPIFAILALVSFSFGPYSLPIWALFLGLPLIEFILLRKGGPLQYFYTMNAALLFGLFKYVKGVKSSVWQPTKRNQS
jgi:cellulose synthase/poly-beta-1,6-N-acetylglucosamine synthase-like glycosyltransferase